MMNTITIAEIRRGGMHAIDAAVSRSPAYVMKRNQAEVVVLRRADYEQLLRRQAVETQPAVSGLDYFLAIPVPQGGGLSGQAMADRIQGLRDDWDDR